MSFFRHTIASILLLFLLSSALCIAHQDAIVDHHDYIQINKQLTLSQVIELTLKNHPNIGLSVALEEEANALVQRGKSWLAGAPSIAMRYQDDLPGDDIGLREIEVELELPLWNWGQRAASQAVGVQAEIVAKKQQAVLKLEVAGLVRKSLWDIALKNYHYQQARQILSVSEELLFKINRRVELGDLPRSDLLLSKSDHLQKRLLVVQAEAELMHARQSYISLTKMTEMPVEYTEEQSSNLEISTNHPGLSAINAVIQRKQAELAWVKSAGSGQSSFILGGKSEKHDDKGDDIESMSVEFSIPFGGKAHLAPEIAATNLQLNQALAQRSHFFRELEKDFHEAKHALEVSLIEIKIANEMKNNAEEHLKMTRLSFSEGEINLIDFLKIQTRSFKAIRNAKAQDLTLQKNIALYNQAVGVLP